MFAGLKKSEDVCFEGFYLAEFQFFNRFFNKCKMPAIDLNEMNPGTTSRGKFITNTAGTGKQVKNLDSIKIEEISQDVKKAFFGFICCRTCFKTFWWM